MCSSGGKKLFVMFIRTVLDSKGTINIRLHRVAEASVTASTAERIHTEFIEYLHNYPLKLSLEK